ncbi:translocation and assembly module lipoprotein TamL [Yeosuana marina]|uniref:translocation and assembly module lipoprotein TamL n=1 Tax=Yeosuana marina TaxID=1565536 RepID=UPI001420DB55|nr:BamA/TamA family outer membrane protein [Yeosuana marina]
MKHAFNYILSFIIISVLITSCDAVKRVPESDYLLTKNSVHVNGKKDNTETINNLLYQKPNSKILNYPLRLNIYNLARPNIDSIVNANLDKKPHKRAHLESFLSKKQLDKYIDSRISFNDWLKKTGEAPVILNEDRTKKSIKRLNDYYINNGWFDVESNYEIHKKNNQRAEVDYFVKTGNSFIIDSISKKYEPSVVDSIYRLVQRNSFIKQNEQYKTVNLQLERDRITSELRNKGVYHFSQDYIAFEVDTVGTNKKVNIEVQIQDRAIRNQDSVRREPFKIYNIKDVNIYTDGTYERRSETRTDSINYNGYTIYSIGKMRFNPKALTDAIFITPKNIFKDIDRTRSYRYLSELRTFKYPDIKYIENDDETLTTNIFLTPLKKFGLNFSTEVSQSNIQTIGLAVNPSILIRNIFRGAETLELSGIGSIGASKDASNKSSNQFFDINEIGVNLNLTIPRLFSPFNTDYIVPKYMSPSTRISLSATSQTNIGLDKQTFSGTFNYKWSPSRYITNRLDIFNAQYVRNLNVGNYFGVYQNSFKTLNAISTSLNYNNGENLNFPDQTDAFISDVLNNNTTLNPNDADYKTVSNINERKQRLTENNLIFSSSFGLVEDTRKNIYDENFSIFRVKLELAGNILSSASSLLGLNKDSSNRYELFNVAFSQYAKTELDYIKHWNLGKKNVFAVRSYAGIAIPYGNSTSIPFSKSFFAGGANDNRAWTAYSLGPGSSESSNEFNEANFKLAFSAEERFNLFGSLNGAVFVDAGNIWNVLDEVNDKKAIFSGFNSLKDIAVGSGFGLRYDFSFFVFRFDIGFKTYDPSYQDKNRWFNDYNFGNAVYNIGINYPF